MSDAPPRGKIKILKDGPYHVTGGLPMREDRIISGADGEPERWEKGESLKVGESCVLCRCGKTENPPYCDGTHRKIGFDGTETAGNEPYLAGVEKTVGPKLDLTWSAKYCALIRYCHRGGDAWNLTEASDDPDKRALAVQEACDCPSGSLIAWEKDSGRPIEPELEPSIGLVENRETGQSGPLWIKGGIPIVSVDGTAYKVRNRVTLCRCGGSEKKPFCDGAHISRGYKSGR